MYIYIYICKVLYNTVIKYAIIEYWYRTQYRTCTFRHLKDLEVVPHPFWHLKDLEVVPHPRGEMLSSMNSPNKQRKRKWEKTPKPKIRLVIYHDCFVNIFSPKIEYDPMVDTHILV